MEQYVTYKKLIDKLEEFANKHPNINSFGFGNLVEFGKDVENTTPLYPLLFVVPQTITYDEAVSQYGVQIFLADKLNDDQEGAVSIVSEMSLISKDLLGTFKLNDDFMYLADYDFPITAAPFLERFNDVLAGVSMTVNFNVSDYLDICQLNDDLTPQLYIDATRSDFDYNDNGQYGSIILVSKFPKDGSLPGTNVYNSILDSGYDRDGQFPKRLQTSIPLNDTEDYFYRILSLNNGAVYWNGILTQENEPYSSVTCENIVQISFTGDNKTDWYYTLSPDYDCPGYPDFKVITSDGIKSGDTYYTEWRMVVNGTYYYPGESQYIEVRPNEQEYDFSAFFRDGDEVQIYLRDTRTGIVDTQSILEVEDVEVSNQTCEQEIVTTFNLTGDTKIRVYLKGKEDCAPIPSPTPTNTPTQTVTPTITPTPTPTMTPTPSSSVWSPADMTNLQDWWRADTGVSLTGSDVDSWSGYNGNLITPVNASQKASYDVADTDWNGEPSITINPNNLTSNTEVGYTTESLSSGISDKTFYMVCKIDNLQNEKGLLVMKADDPSTHRIAILTRTTGTPSSLYGFTDGPVIPSSYTSLNTDNTNGSYLFVAVSYSTSGELNWYSSNSSILGSATKNITGASTTFDADELEIGSYIGAIKPSSKFSVVEVIATDNTIATGTELTNLQNYLNTRYGI